MISRTFSGYRDHEKKCGMRVKRPGNRGPATVSGIALPAVSGSMQFGKLLVKQGGFG